LVSVNGLHETVLVFLALPLRVGSLGPKFSKQLTRSGLRKLISSEVDHADFPFKDSVLCLLRVSPFGFCISRTIRR
jgi:hypothetical protein